MPLGKLYWYGEHKSDIQQFEELEHADAVYANEDRIYKVLRFSKQPDIEDTLEVENSMKMYMLGLGPTIYDVQKYKDCIVIEMERYPYDIRQYLMLNKSTLSDAEKDRLGCKVQQLLWNLASTGFLNADTKDKNIVYNDENDDIRLIDFETNLFKHVKTDVSEQEAILLLAIMELLYYFYTENYGINLFRTLPSGNIGYYPESWKNKVMLIIAGRVIQDTPILNYILSYYTYNAPDRLEVMIAQLERDIKLSSQRDWLKETNSTLGSIKETLLHKGDLTKGMSQDETCETSEPVA